MLLEKKFVYLKRFLIFFKKINSLKKLLNGYLTLVNNDYIANFLHEGNLKIYIPKILILNLILKPKKTLEKLKRSIYFISRPYAEVLLRKTIFSLYDKKYIDKNKSVIDIGCWIADNTLAWAPILKNDAIIFAIDPSVENLLFGKELGALNKISNVKWINAVCYDKIGIPLSFKGSIDHAQFKEEKKSSNSIISTTLDKIINKNSIGLMHIDVEGLELKVLRGARKIIELNRPVIIFENLISRPGLEPIISFLNSYKYDVYMINEVLPGCDLDCRNFIAFDSKRKLPKIENPVQKQGIRNGIYYASIGPVLIKM